MRRRFSSSERVDLYLAADGYCSECGVALQPGWHADHVVPYCLSQVTDVANGQALCPACNLAKGSRWTTTPATPGKVASTRSTAA
jgi:5-methylcytosine-specific restriction endonuclease McrA